MKRYFIVILVIAFSLFFNMGVTFMDTATLRPNSDGTTTGWDCLEGGGAPCGTAHYLAVDEVITQPSTDEIDLFTLHAPRSDANEEIGYATLSDADTVSQVDIWSYLQSEGTCWTGLTISIYINGDWETPVSISSGAGRWVQTTFSTGWDLSDDSLDELQVRYSADFTEGCPMGYYNYVYATYADITYTAVSADTEQPAIFFGASF